MKLKKARLRRLGNGDMYLTPVEAIKNGFFDWENSDRNLETVKIDPPKINLWIYRKCLGINCMLDEEHIANPPSEEELREILDANQGICFVQVDEDDKLNSPSNGLGHRSIIIELTNNKK